MKIYKRLFEVEKPSRNTRLKLNRESRDYMSDYLESTFNINKDILILYNKSILPKFVMFFNRLKDDKLDISFLKKLKQLKVGNILETFDSSMFITKEAKKAHSLNPIKIEIGVFEKGSSYDPNDRTIQINIDHKVLSFLTFAKYGINSLKTMLSTKELKILESELSSITFKTRISHELSHWISDSLYNNHLKRVVNLSIKLDKKITDLLKQKDVDMTYFEIDAQVHAVKQLKKHHLKDWDKMTIDDLFDGYSRLKAIYEEIFKDYGKEVVEVWIKNLIKRLSREKLLGNNMNHFPDIKKMNENYYKSLYKIY